MASTRRSTSLDFLAVADALLIFPGTALAKDLNCSNFKSEEDAQAELNKNRSDLPRIMEVDRWLSGPPCNLRAPLLRAVTAGLIVWGVVEAGPAFVGFLRSRTTWVQSLVALAALLAFAWAGFTTQLQRGGTLSG
jgi:hypothetical protein